MEIFLKRLHKFISPRSQNSDGARKDKFNQRNAASVFTFRKPGQKR